MRTYGKPKRPEGAPTVQVLLWWNDKAKRWDMRVEGPGGALIVKHVETTAPMDSAELYLLATAVKEEMEAWIG